MAAPEACLECIVTRIDEDSDHRHSYCVFSQNITHNLGKMADAVGVYEACWRPEELIDKEAAFEIRRLEDAYFSDRKPENRHYYDEARALREQYGKLVYGRHLVPLLRDGIAKLKADPETYRKLEPENKWGTYDKFIPWLEKYLEACEQYPDARVVVSR
jgi:hypothetical protein